MSSGQKPRWPHYFPAMKVRNKKRRRPVRVVLRDSNWEPIWPLGEYGFIRGVGRLRFSVNGRSREFDPKTGYWVEVPND